MQDLNQEHAAPGWRKPLIAALLLGGAVSAAAGIANAFHNSSDFQWSGAHLLLHHVDPWREELAGNPRGLIYKIQQPNYLPLLYVLISPVGLLSAVAAQKVWAFCNLAFLLLSLWGTNRFYGLRSFSGAGLVTALALMATPMRVAIGNGQQSLLVLLVWCLALQHVRLQRRDITIAGISYLKFSFAPPLVMYLWLKNGFRALLWSAIPALAGLIVVWLWMTHGHSLHQLVVFAFEPLKVAQHGYFPIGEDPNLMDQIEPFLWGHTLTMVQYTAIILTPSLLLTFLMLFNAIKRHPGSSAQWHLALLGGASYILFRHHPYDAVTLLFPLAYSVSQWRSPLAKTAFFLLTSVMVLERITYALAARSPWYRATPHVMFALEVIALWLIWRLPSEQSTFSQE